MTPTRDQLDAALRRSQSGFGVMAGDATDPDERALMLDWLMDLNARAVAIEIPCQDTECCHNCRHLIADHHHPVVDGESILGRKGWICAGFLMDEGEPVVFSGWGEHGMCEMWTPRGEPTATDDTPSVAEGDKQGAEGASVPPEAQTPTQRHSALDCNDGCSDWRFTPDPELDHSLKLLVEEPPPPGETWRDGLWWNGRYWQGVKQAWPPPAKGTHEWDLDFIWPGIGDPVNGALGLGTSLAGRAWSRSR